MKTALTTAAFVALTAGMANAELIADAAGDYNLTQGFNGWSYGYVVGSYDATDFAPMTADVSSNAYWADNARFWTGGGTKEVAPFVNRAWLHANAPNTTKEGDVQAAVRRWTSYVDKTINLSGNIADNPNNLGRGDGAIAAIYIDGDLLQSWFIDAGDTDGIDYSFDIDMDFGTEIDFVVEAGQNANYDTILFDSRITPTPGSLALIGLGGMIATRRRR